MWLVLLILGFIIGLVKTIIIKKFWLWFIVYYFHVAPLSFWIAYGFSLFISILTPLKMCSQKDFDTNEEIINNLALQLKNFFTWLFSLGLIFLLGYIAHLFV